jgi:hypothetical protein
MRSDATQFCPQLMKVPPSAACTARSMSASSHTMSGSLPPSSSTTGVSVSAAARSTRRPLGTLPMKSSTSTPPAMSACAVSA